MMLKRMIAITLLTGLAPVTQAKEWVVLPVLGDNYKADFAIAAIVGKTDIKEGDTVSTKGIEVSLNCPLLQPPNHIIRQQVSYLQSDEKGIETTSFELNPHHMFKATEKLKVGFGPSLGLSNIDNGSDDDNVFTYGLGASARYDITKTLFVSTEARYAWSDDVELAGVDDDFENLRLTAKMGYQF